MRGEGEIADRRKLWKMIIFHPEEGGKKLAVFFFVLLNHLKPWGAPRAMQCRKYQLICNVMKAVWKSKYVNSEILVSKLPFYPS